MSGLIVYGLTMNEGLEINLNTEFWYGLRNIHCLTEREEVELQIEVRQDNGTGQVWTYGYFEVDGPETNYTLHIGQAQGSSGVYDSMAEHNGMQFTTTDRDNDIYTIDLTVQTPMEVKVDGGTRAAFIPS